MTLQQLLDAMNAAKAALDKAPEDEALKAKFEEAKTAYEAKKAEEGEEGDDEDESKWDDKTKAYIQKLRGENAKQRTKAKELASKAKDADEKRKAILKAAGIEEESEKPEEKLKNATAQSHVLTFRNAILETALENGIAKDEVEYFSFLVEKRTSELKDDEELSDEAMTAIVTEVKKRNGGGKGNTSVNGKGGKEGSGNPPPEGSGGEVTLDQFTRMNMSEKAGLYGKHPEVYNKLLTEAKRTNRLV